MQDVAEIKDALLGTPYASKGIVGRVEDLEKDMRDLNVIKWKIMGAAGATATIVSVISSIILKVLF